jgi:DNA helicase-2/ATP-dependent DNA helicase PcrA
MRRVRSPYPQPWIADLHIHSKYSRACSRDLELENLSWWAQRKGITLLGTGDFTHPAWFDHIRESLRPAEPGLFRLAPDREADIARRLPAGVRAPVRFMLSVEISTIYKRDDRTRKVHHLVYLPDFEAVARFNGRLGHGPGGLGGNLGSDGRPILGLDSRDLLEIALESSPDAFLVPAHIWTPWFSALGSKSGFDAIADCYADLAGHIKAVETGLSSDPEMNWRVPSLDAYQLVSNSDAHSPQALGREATALTGELDYFSVRRALETGDGLHATVEFFPEEGKYHADGHRGCGVRWDPEQTRLADGRCPECGRPLTIGVLHRVEELAERPSGYRPEARPEVIHLIQLSEIIGEIQGVGAKSKSVEGRASALVAALGSELAILTTTPVDEIAKVGGDVLGEAIARLRRGQVRRTPGYDGEYGVIRLFEPGELSERSGARVPSGTQTLFDVEGLSPAGGATTGRVGGGAAGRSAAATRAAAGAGRSGGAGHDGPGQSGSSQSGSGPDGSARSRTGQGGAAQSGAAHGGSGHGGLGHGGLGRTGGSADEADPVDLIGEDIEAGDGTWVGAGGDTGTEPAGTDHAGAAVLTAAGRRVPGQSRPGRAGRSDRAGGPSQPPPPIAAPPSPHRPWEPMLAGMEEVGTGLLDRLDSLQRVAASAPGGPLLVVAGPGTGKTRTLTHRIAYLCAELKVVPERCLAITFTRRAAEEMGARLTDLLGDAAEQVTVSTFHALGLRLLRENLAAAGLAEGLSVADDATRAEIQAETGEDATAYRKILRERNLVDLDELVTLTVSILAADPELVERYRDRWRWVFVDEYQDIDATQYELLRLLVPADGNVCAIGDPDQSIYSFRGSDVGYFLRFAEDFVDARVVRLTRNYRSSAPIIAAALQAIAPTSLVRERRLEPARLDPDAALIGVHAAATVSAEAEWVAKTVDAIVGGVSHRSFDLGGVDSRTTVHGGLSFADIAVLYRTDAQARPVVEALTRAGVPVQKRSHDRLADRRAVARIARELRFAADRPEGGGAGSAGIEPMDAGRPGAEVAGEASAGAGLAEGWLVRRVREVGRRLASDAPRLTDLARVDGDGADESPLSEVDVYSAVELLLPLAQRCGDDLDGFLQALATGAEVDAIDPRAQAVTLLTLHAAKGLEWPVVFIVGCEDGLVPLRLASLRGTAAEVAEALAEERRLFFVGITRAQHQLYLSHTLRRNRSGGEQRPTRTPFLDVVDPGLLERIGTPAQEAARPRHRQLRLI